MRAQMSMFPAIFSLAAASAVAAGCGGLATGSGGGQKKVVDAKTGFVVTEVFVNHRGALYGAHFPQGGLELYAQGLNDAGEVLAYPDGSLQAPVKSKGYAWVNPTDSLTYYGAIIEFKVPEAATQWRLKIDSIYGRQNCQVAPDTGKISDFADLDKLKALADKGDQESQNEAMNEVYSEQGRLQRSQMLEFTCDAERIFTLKGTVKGHASAVSVNLNGDAQTVEVQPGATREEAVPFSFTVKASELPSIAYNRYKEDRATESSEYLAKKAQRDQLSSRAANYWPGGFFLAGGRYYWIPQSDTLTLDEISYAVKPQPSTDQQDCQVVNGSGSFELGIKGFLAAGGDEEEVPYFEIYKPADVEIVCTDLPQNKKVNVTVSGLKGTLTLKDDAGETYETTNDGSGDKLVVADTTFSSESSLGVAIETQPEHQTCVLPTERPAANEAGEYDITVTCTLKKYFISGNVTGLTGTLQIQNGAGIFTVLPFNPIFQFTQIDAFSAYAVTVKTQPPGQVCTVATEGTGSSLVGPVTNAHITCADTSYSVGGTITGLSGTLVLTNNGTNAFTAIDANSFTFSQKIAHGSPYNVAVSSSPTGYRCSVSNGSGTVSGAAITNVSVTCQAERTIGGTVTGLDSGASFIIREFNTPDPFRELTISSNGGYTFNGKYTDGYQIYVQIMTESTTGQTCDFDDLSAAGATINGSNITDVNITCTAAPN